ncbi:hypothetical protein AB3S75_031049 [Citrus x aurantiifolia]
MANLKMSPTTSIADNNLLFNILSFDNLSYRVQVSKQLQLPFFWKAKFAGSQEPNTKLLLDNISGEAREGEIMAILGASGAGKTTLMDALAGRIEKESLQGSVTLNGEVLESKLLKIISAYVMQDDLLFPMLTVEETLMFAAEFRLPRSVTKTKKQERVEALINQLGLRSAAKTFIGDERRRGVSGGERRRVSIGIHIIHDPILLFLDEPTSGLDSTSAFMVVNVLQRIAKSGSIVIMSIHQPSYRILSLLDRLIILSHGQSVYNETPSNLAQFFAEFGHPVPENENKIEFALDLMRELEESSSDGITSLVEFNKSWQVTKKNGNKVPENANVSLKDAIKASISKGKLVSAGETISDGSNLTSSVQTFANPFWIETIVISKRLLTNSRRIPELFGIRFGSVLVTGFILATLFWKLQDSPKGALKRLGFFAFAMTTIFYICAREIPALLQERDIFIRETSYNTYRHSSYVFAHSLVSMPPITTLSITFAVTTFWAVGLSGGFSGFLFFFITIFASFWAGSSFMAFIAGLVSHIIIGFTIVVAILGYFLLFCGFYIPRDEIPPYWIWFHYVSLVKYPFQGVLQNEFGDPSKCFVSGVQVFDDTPFEGLPFDTKIKLLENMSNVLGNNITSSTCVTTGMKLLEQKGVTDISKWKCFWITVAFGFLFRVLFYFTLLFGSKNKRR